MKTDKKRQISTITKDYLENRHSETTEEKIQQWLIADEDAEEKEQASLECWNALETKPNTVTYEVLKRVKAKIGFPQSIPFYRRMMRVAAIMLPTLLILGSVYYFTLREKTIQVVALNGETKHLVLPDNSEVWLNAGSSIQYSSAFGEESRPVLLEGEAWFSVQKDVSRPFVVSTKNLSVKVLGTEFNVKAYPKESKTIATLATGKIEIKTNSNQTKILEPNEQLVFDNLTASMEVGEVSPNDASSWKTGELVFINATFEEIIQTLERRFNVSFEGVEAFSHLKGQYTIKFLKNEKLGQVLTILQEVVGGFSYEKKHNTIILHKL